MKKEYLLEVITGEKNPKFVNEREGCIIDKCLSIINNFETTIPTLDYYMLNVISEALQKEYDRYAKSSGIAKLLSVLADSEGLAKAKSAKAEIDSNKMHPLGHIAFTMKRIDEIKEAYTQAWADNVTVNKLNTEAK